ncbi:MAG: hypothetical protein R2763_00385 [Mycobacterium sp.]
MFLLIPALVLGMSGCGSRDSGPQVLVGKGTPYGNLLVPKLTATVEDALSVCRSISPSP